MGDSVFMDKKLFIFLIIGLFLISFISAEEYKEVKYNEYKILSQTNLELAYDVSFSEPNINGTITISACVENETKELIDFKVDKDWDEKLTWCNYILGWIYRL